MVTYLRDHWDSCMHRLHRLRLKGKEVPGTGIGTFRRGSVMQLDHKVLKDREAVLAAPYTAVLTMVDVATRIVQYVPAVTQRAEESAHAVITR